MYTYLYHGVIYKYIYIYTYYIYTYLYTSKVSNNKQRKQLIWNLKFRADTVANFSQINKTLKLQYHGIFYII